MCSATVVLWRSIRTSVDMEVFTAATSAGLKSCTGFILFSCVACLFLLRVLRAELESISQRTLCSATRTNGGSLAQDFGPNQDRPHFALRTALKQASCTF